MVKICFLTACDKKNIYRYPAGLLFPFHPYPLLQQRSVATGELCACSPVAFIHLLLKTLPASVCRTEVLNTIAESMIEAFWNMVSFCCIFCADVERDVVLFMLEMKEI